MCSGLSSSGMVRDTAGTGAIGTVLRRHRPEVREGPEDQVTPVDLAGSAAAAVRGAEDHVAAVVSEAPSAAAAAEASAVPAAEALVGASAVVAEASVAAAEDSEVALAAAVAAAADLAAGEC